MPNPGVMDDLIRERQARLRTMAHRPVTRDPASLRVRLGHALIAVGSSLSGERVERVARRSAAHGA